MIGNAARSETSIQLLAPIAASNTSDATGAWTDVRHVKGDLVITCSVGVVTDGQIVPLIQTASDDQGAGIATLAANDGAWTTVTTSNDPLVQTRTFRKNHSLGYIRFLGTITTGPAVVGVTMLKTAV